MEKITLTKKELEEKHKEARSNIEWLERNKELTDGQLRESRRETTALTNRLNFYENTIWLATKDRKR